MTLIVCVDDRMGMAFNRRRQSRDRAVYDDIAALCAGVPIAMDERSCALFEGLTSAVNALKPLPDAAAAASFCFVEFEPPSRYEETADRLILYGWNRHYPADLRFDIDLAGWNICDEHEFPGTSHDCITRRIYKREKI